MLALNIAFMALTAASIVGLLAWSIATQHRNHGCAELRIRRLRISVRLVSADEPNIVRAPSIVPEA